MKKSIISLLFLLSACVFSANIVFAGEPIAGVDINLGKNPGGSIAFHGQTGRDGKFSAKLEEGTYTLSLSYNNIASKVGPMDKSNALNKGAYEFTLTLEDKSLGLMGACEEKRMHKPFVITKELGKAAPQFIVPKGGGTISGTLTFIKLNEPNVKMISNGNKF